jgi:hypothetical protein
MITENQKADWRVFAVIPEFCSDAILLQESLAVNVFGFTEFAVGIYEYRKYRAECFNGAVEYFATAAKSWDIVAKVSVD